MARSGSRRVRRNALAGGCAAVASTVVGISISAAVSSASTGYRTAAVTRSSVTKTLDVSGTLEPVNQASVSFQVAGTVSSVAVTTGQHVNAGQMLASLDPTTLQQTVDAAQSSLAADQAKLSQDEAGQTSTASAASGSAAGTTSAITGGDAVILSAASTSGSTAGLQAAQQAVVSAQQKADTDSQTAAAALANAESTCSATPSTSTSTTTTPASTTAPSSTSATTAPSSGGSSSSDACTSALNTAMNAQSQVSSDQTAVSTAETALAKLLAADASSLATPTSPSSGTGKTVGGGSGGSSGTAAKPTGGSGASSGVGAGSATGGGSSTDATRGAGGDSSVSGGPGGAGGSGVSPTSGSSQSVTITASQLAVDQATIDSAEATLVGAQQSLADAQLTSPISGTVASIGLTTGQSLSSGSSSNTITVINSGGYQTVSSLTSTQVSQVSVGDRVHVSVNGTSTSIAGTVSRVGPVVMGSSSDTYPLVVALEPGPPTMSVGSTAALAIDEAQAAGALVVPTSAVHTGSPGRSYVIVLQSGKEKQTRVSVGVVGSVYTQITSGLTEGETVVLADPSLPLPSSTNSTGPTFGGGGGFPGGGFGGGAGGFPGGGARTGGGAGAAR